MARIGVGLEVGALVLVANPGSLHTSGAIVWVAGGDAGAQTDDFMIHPQYWHCQERLRDAVNDHLERLTQSFASKDVCMASETLEVIVMVEQKFKNHLPAALPTKLRETMESVQTQSVWLCQEHHQAHVELTCPTLS